MTNFLPEVATTPARSPVLLSFLSFPSFFLSFILSFFHLFSFFLSLFLKNTESAGKLPEETYFNVTLNFGLFFILTCSSAFGRYIMLSPTCFPLILGTLDNTLHKFYFITLSRVEQSSQKELFWLSSELFLEGNSTISSTNIFSGKGLIAVVKKLHQILSSPCRLLRLDFCWQCFASKQLKLLQTKMNGWRRVHAFNNNNNNKGQVCRWDH